MKRRDFGLGLVMVATMALLGSCYNGPGYGPPPHAPAHGYRSKHRHGANLVYDAALGVYVVAGLRYHYFHDGHFYRFHGGIWQVGVHPKGPWRHVSVKRLPPGLRKKGPGGGPPHRGRGPAEVIMRSMYFALSA